MKKLYLFKLSLCICFALITLSLQLNTSHAESSSLQINSAVDVHQHTMLVASNSSSSSSSSSSDSPSFSSSSGSSSSSSASDSSSNNDAPVQVLNSGPVKDVNFDQLGDIVERHLGKVIILNFFATWCPPCKKEIPSLVSLTKKRGQEVVVIGLSIDQKPELLPDFIKDFEINYEVYRAKRDIQNTFEVKTIPHNVVFDTTGELVANESGYISEREFNNFIDKLGKNN